MLTNHSMYIKTENATLVLSSYWRLHILALWSIISSFYKIWYKKNFILHKKICPLVHKITLFLYKKFWMYITYTHTHTHTQAFFGWRSSMWYMHNGFLFTFTMYIYCETEGFLCIYISKNQLFTPNYTLKTFTYQNN